MLLSLGPLADAAVLLLSLLSCANASSPSSNERAIVRSYFYAGGEYVATAAGHLFSNQMYVEKLERKAGSKQPYPLIFIHGQGQSGTNWLNKPDGSEGWASYFVNKGYDVYIIDQTYRGRSAWNPASGIAMSTYSAEIIEQRFTAPKDFNLWPQASLHTRWPGTGLMGDAIFDTFYSSNVEFASATVTQETMMQAAGAALLDIVGPAVLVSHSQGGLFPWLWADSRPDLVKAIVSIEPTGPPFQDVIFNANTSARPYGLTNIPLTYSPPTSNFLVPLDTQVVTSTEADLLDCVIQSDPPRQLTNLINIPVLLEQSEASYHAQYDYCTAMFLEQAGVEVDFLKLADVGIHGNGHLHFMEDNSDDIALLLHKWIRKTVEA